MHDDFRRALEEIKLRAPVEEVVREYVPALRKAGSLWVACCPFHEEKTPSFKVDPRRGTWHCFGACSEGGDQIRFVERFCGIAFREAIELLAARTGVELPRRRRDGPGRAELAAEHEALESAARFYETKLLSAAGEEARRYLEKRGLAPETWREFRLGFAPGDAHALIAHARQSRIPFEVLERAGLARRNDRGQPYDFFRGRLMIPIRDLEGRVVGFGARLIAEGASGPKYVNSPETAVFRKNRLIYGLDRAIGEVRRSGRLVLVEGYTDVMAAHQAGFPNVVAVLGTSTTEEHTGLIRRSGARRATLVFDGDEAGRKAALRALQGLLPLEIELEVVALPGGLDPCDLLCRGEAQGFRGRLERAQGWFDHLCAGLGDLRGAELSAAVDQVLELLARLRKPVHREALLAELGRRAGIPVESLREQSRMAPGARAMAARGGADAPLRERASAPARGQAGELLAKAYEGLVRAVLLDESLVPLVRPFVGSCPEPDLKRILEVVLELYEDGDSLIDAARVMTLLEEHPARRLVPGLAEPREGLESPKSLLEGELSFLRGRERERQKRELSRRILELQLSIDQSSQDPHREGGAPSEELAAARDELERLRLEYGRLLEDLRRPTPDPLASPLSHSARSE